MERNVQRQPSTANNNNNTTCLAIPHDCRLVYIYMSSRNGGAGNSVLFVRFFGKQECKKVPAGSSHILG